MENKQNELSFASSSYILSGATFRQELVAMLQCKSEAQMRRERSMMTRTTKTTSVRLQSQPSSVGQGKEVPETKDSSEAKDSSKTKESPDANQQAAHSASEVAAELP